MRQAGGQFGKLAFKRTVPGERTPGGLMFAKRPIASGSRGIRLLLDRADGRGYKYEEEAI